jgi:glutamyl-tRNA reductase
VGLGEMGSLMLKYVQENTTKIFASSKTFANAEKYSDVLTPVRYEDRYQVIGKCDVVILCSACQEPIITKEEYAKAIGTVEKSKRLVIDLGSPRNAEASVGELTGVQYVCVDDLEKVVSENRRLRMIELEAAQKILKEGIEEFLQWMRMDEVSKQISMHAERMLKSANEESEKLLRSMPDLPEEDRHRVQMMYERFAKKMANDFLYKVKAENSPEDVQVFLKCLGANNE